MMPLHEYQCDRCGDVFEELIRRPSDTEALRCASCGSAEVHRILSRPAAFGASDCGSGAASGFG